MIDGLPDFLAKDEVHAGEILTDGKASRPFIDKTLHKVAGFVASGYIQNELSSNNGFMQRFDARMKVLFLVYFVILISIQTHISGQIYFSVILGLLFFFSRINLLGVYKKILVFTFLLGFLVAAPASLNLFNNGKVIFPIVHFKTSYHIWIYHVPSIIGITYEGCLLVTKLILKVMNSIGLTFLIYYTTPFNEIIKSLKIFRVPGLLLMTITLAYKFIFILSQTTEETYLAMKSKLWRKLNKAGVERVIAGRMAYIFRKSWVKYEEIFFAMTARGFTGDVNLCYLKKLQMKDWAFLVLFILTGLVGFIF
jgi:cobalt/nickel transport system permease protein